MTFELCPWDPCLTRLIDGFQAQKLHDHNPDVRKQINQRVRIHGDAEHEDDNFQAGKSVLIMPDGTILLGHHALAGSSNLLGFV